MEEKRSGGVGERGGGGRKEKKNKKFRITRN